MVSDHRPSDRTASGRSRRHCSATERYACRVGADGGPAAAEHDGRRRAPRPCLRLTPAGRRPARPPTPCRRRRRRPRSPAAATRGPCGRVTPTPGRGSAGRLPARPRPGRRRPAPARRPPRRRRRVDDPLPGDRQVTDEPHRAHGRRPAAPSSPSPLATSARRSAVEGRRRIIPGGWQRGERSARQPASYRSRAGLGLILIGRCEVLPLAPPWTSVGTTRPCTSGSASPSRWGTTLEGVRHGFRRLPLELARHLLHLLLLHDPVPGHR